jgi:predicted MFS family arabinose efflux permease
VSQEILSDTPPRAWRCIFAGLCASFLGIGLARFAYSPLLPALIGAHWFEASAAAYLGAANLAGYLIGALIGRQIGARLGNVRSLRLMEILVTLAFLACASPRSIEWYFGWRLLSGIAGGVVMVLVAATVLPQVADRHKGIASGAVFLGVGLGIAASGTLVPLLLRHGVAQAWLGLAALSAVLTATTWSWWPSPAAGAAATLPSQHGTSLPASAGTAIGALYVIYGLTALGLVPAMMFLVDFVGRDLGTGPDVASLFWIIYGIGAIFGPPLYGWLADLLGASVAVRALLVVQVIAVTALAAFSNRLLVSILVFVIGSFPPGNVPLFMAWIRETIPTYVTAQNVVWSRATVVFAACQAVGGYAYSALYTIRADSHRTVFVVGAIAFAVAIVIELIAAPAIRSTRERCRVAPAR